MNKPKLVVMDIDGTLRTKEVRNIGPITKEAFERLHKDGVLLGVASGRPLWQGVEKHYQEWNMSFQFDLLIGLNGSETLDTRTNLFSTANLLSKESLKKIVQAMDQFHLNPFVYRDGYQLSERIDEDMIESSIRHSSKLATCKDISELWSEETAKLLYRTKTSEEGERIEAFGKTLCDSNITCFRTAPNLLEFQNPQINKGVAVKNYCAKNHIDLKDVLSFGDAENDIEMLKITGYSVCLLNGMDEVKAITNAVTEYDCLEDGVGHWLFDHIINQ